MNTLIEDYCSKLVSLRFQEQKVALLTGQNRFLKSIVFADEIRDACVEVIRCRNLSKKSAIAIQRAYKKYRWRKNYNRVNKSVSMFDLGRVRAAMGKENLQILFSEIEGSMEILTKALF